MNIGRGPGRCAAGVLLAWMVLAATPARAQQPTEAFTLMLRGVPTQEALAQLVETTQINLIYDPELIRDVAVYCTAREEPAEVLLRCITQAAGLDYYRLSSGTYVLIEAVRQAPRYGTLAGVVVDGDTGEPLPYANVYLADASAGTAANAAGLFALSRLLPGPYTIVTSYVGYEQATDSVWISPGAQVRRAIALRARPVTARPVVVNGLQQRLPSAGLGTGQLEPGKGGTGAGYRTSDVLRGASDLLGVATRSPAADLHIQGGEAGENRLQLDGMPVLDPVSLGRLLGAFSPLAIGRVTVHKAGFDAAQGSQTAGILALEHDLHYPGQAHLVTQVDPISFNAGGGVDLAPLGVQGRVMGAVRTSLWGAYRYPALDDLIRQWNTVDPLLTATALGLETDALQFVPHQSSSDVGFTDVHLAGRLRLNPFHQLYATFYDGRNEAATDLLVSDAAALDTTYLLLTRDRYDWQNQAGQLRYEWLMGARALGTVRLRDSRYRLRHAYQLASSRDVDLPDGLPVEDIEEQLRAFAAANEAPDEADRMRETALEARLDYSVAAGHALQVGLEAVYNTSAFTIESGFFTPIRLDGEAVRLAAFVQDEVALSPRTTVTLGTRLTYVPAREAVYAEPRAALRYDAPAGALGTFAGRLAAGIYRQFVNTFDLSSVGPSAVVPSVRFWLPVDATLAPARAYHVAGEVLWMPGRAWRITLEGYYKQQPRIVAIDYAALLHYEGTLTEQSDFIAGSSGYAYGGGLRVEQEGAWGRVGAGYSLGQARRSFPSRFEGRRQPVPWNEPHRLTLSLDARLAGGLAAHAYAQGRWGRSWGFRQAYYDYLAAHNGAGAYPPFDLAEPDDHRLPPFYQLDLGLSYTRPFGGLQLRARADLVNVLDRKNVLDWSLAADPERAGRYVQMARTAMPFHATFSLQLSY